MFLNEVMMISSTVGYRCPLFRSGKKIQMADFLAGVGISLFVGFCTGIVTIICVYERLKESEIAAPLASLAPLVSL